MFHTAADGMIATVWQANPAQHPGTGNAAFQSMLDSNFPADTRNSARELGAQGLPRKLLQQIRLAYRCLKLLRGLQP